MIRIKRVYGEPSSKDGMRILIDRIWPRGVSKDRAKIDEWSKELAPSTTLRKWFGHDPAKWGEFRTHYRKELRDAEQQKRLVQIAKLGKRKTVTLIYSAADEQHNQAVVLKELLDGLA